MVCSRIEVTLTMTSIRSVDATRVATAAVGAVAYTATHRRVSELSQLNTASKNLAKVFNAGLPTVAGAAKGVARLGQLLRDQQRIDSVKLAVVSMCRARVANFIAR